MPAGLPDYQTPVNIAAQTLANLSVDIAAQTLATLGVNIKAQDLASLAIDIASQTLSTMAINITAQDLAELVIKIAAQSVGVYLQPGWAAKQGIDKNFNASKDPANFGEGALISYTPAVGKTLYIEGFSVANQFLDAVDSTDPAHAIAVMAIGGTTISAVGGNGGFGIIFSAPKVVAGGTAITVLAVNNINHNMNLVVTAWGWEE